MAFIPTGLVKATGNRFTTLPIDNPVGFFFEAMFQTGPFWYFIGFMQIAAGTLLLIPTTATLGAIMFVPIIFSIVLVTYGIGFGGTVYVTALMLLAAIYLVCWDADKIWSAEYRIFEQRESMPLLAGATIVEKTSWIMGGVVGMALLMTTRGFVPASWRIELLAVGVLCFFTVVGSWVFQAVRSAGSASRDNLVPSDPMDSQNG